MLDKKNVHHVSQKEIAFVLRVSKGLVTKLKQYHDLHPEESRPATGRPSALREIFPDLKAFVEQEITECRSVTMSVLMAYATDKVRTPISRDTLCRYMERHHFSYVSAAPMDAYRVAVKEDDIAAFMTQDLPNALNGIHPSLVFNVDEMGAELFADRKRVFVFVPETSVPRSGTLEVGVPRSTRRCTLLACISLDGSKLCPAIITRTMTINSIVFSEGYMTNNLKIYNTDNSFINNKVFGEWICDVLIPEIRRRRKWLSGRLGTFNDRAVVILDCCSCHTSDAFKLLLRRYNILPLFLVPHSSHMTQALDVGIFGRCKNIIRSDTKYDVNLHELDSVLVEEMEAESGGVQIAPERGKLLGEFIVKVLRSFDQATTPDLVVSAFEQVGIHLKLTDPGNVDRRITYVNPATARVVVDKFGIFQLHEPFRVDPETRCQLKIADLVSAHQTREAQALRNELAEITRNINETQDLGCGNEH